MEGWITYISTLLGSCKIFSLGPFLTSHTFFFNLALICKILIYYFKNINIYCETAFIDFVYVKTFNFQTIFQLKHK